jgi:hypothetical protein
MDQTPNNDERMRILEMIADGSISTSEGIRLLEALIEKPEDQNNYVDDSVELGLSSDSASRTSVDESNQGSTSQDSSTGEPAQAAGEEKQVLIPDEVVEGGPGASQMGSNEEFERKGIPDPKIERWKRWWMLPLWVGVGVTIVAGLLMFLVYQATQLSFWFACTWVPFLMGVALIFLAWGLRRSLWLHVRITQEPGGWPRKIAFSFPLPLGLAAWVMRTFKRWIPGMAHANVDEIMTGINSITSDKPFYIEVDEGEDGERVEIFIG